jgi:transposase InsO family protein
MPRPMTAEAEAAIYDLYYVQHAVFGRDKLYQLLRSKGVDISRRQVMDWLSKQETHQVFAPANRTVNIRNTVLSGAHKVIVIDLIDMQNFADRGFHYILTAIDPFSKKAYARALKNKEAKTVAASMNDMIKKDIKKVGLIRSDNGSEFIAAEFKNMLAKHGIKQAFGLAGKPQSQSHVERFNGTLKRALKMAMRTSQSTDWPTLMKQIIEHYNNTVSRVTGKTANELDKEENNTEILKAKQKIHKSVTSKRGSANTVKLKVGDKVRVKMDTENKERSGEVWSKKLYTVVKLKIPRTAVTSVSYTLALDGEPLKKMFYNNDLLGPITAVQNEINAPEKWEVSKLIKPATLNKKPAYLVYWKGYKASEATIEPRDQLLQDCPKILEAFEKKHNVKFFKSGKFNWSENV